MCSSEMVVFTIKLNQAYLREHLICHCLLFIIMHVHKLGCAAYVNIWRDSVIYDELTINERQKSDAEFATMLDCVRRGCPTDETICILEQRVIQVSVADKLNELSQSGHSPVCLFPTRKACKEFNSEMLQELASEVHEIVCTDGIDQTSSTRKWTKKAAEQLEKLIVTVT